jgi:hypothetical protein
MRRLVASLVAAALALAATGCMMAPLPTGGVELAFCGTGETWIDASGYTYHPADSGHGPQESEFSTWVEVEVGARGADPLAQGDVRVEIDGNPGHPEVYGVDGVGVGNREGDDFVDTRLTPVADMLVCHNTNIPVAIFFRVTAFVLADVGGEFGNYDIVECELGPTDQYARNRRQMTSTDLIDVRAGDEVRITVQCEYSYVPPGWTGPTPEPYPPLPL